MAAWEVWQYTLNEVKPLAVSNNVAIRHRHRRRSEQQFKERANTTTIHDLSIDHQVLPGSVEERAQAKENYKKRRPSRRNLRKEYLEYNKDDLSLFPLEDISLSEIKLKKIAGEEVDDSNSPKEFKLNEFIQEKKEKEKEKEGEKEKEKEREKKGKQKKRHNSDNPTDES